MAEAPADAQLSPTLCPLLLTFDWSHWALDCKFRMHTNEKRSKRDVQCSSVLLSEKDTDMCDFKTNNSKKKLFFWRQQELDRRFF